MKQTDRQGRLTFTVAAEKTRTLNSFVNMKFGTGSRPEKKVNE